MHYEKFHSTRKKKEKKDSWKGSNSREKAYGRPATEKLKEGPYWKSKRKRGCLLQNSFLFSYGQVLENS